MESLFLAVLKMSLAGSVVILAVLLMHLLLRRAPRKYAYLLWPAAAFRLCVPVSLPSPLSLFRVFSGAASPAAAPGGPLALPFAAEAAPAELVTELLPAGSEPVAVTVSRATAGTPFSWLRLLAYLWLGVTAALLLYGLIADLRLRRRLRTAIRVEENVYRVPESGSPFLLGLFRPRIYVPGGMEGEDLRYALAHEKVHLRRGDHWFRLLAWLICSFHWFNPLVWLAFFLVGRDMELSCDEAVLDRLGDVRKEYCEALLRIAAVRPLASGPARLAFGEAGAGRRVRNALRWKKTGAWVTAACLTLCLVFFAACATDPKLPVPKERELTLNADGTIGSLRWGMTPEEAAAADSSLSFFEYDENRHASVEASLENVTVLGHPAEVRLHFPKHSMEGGRKHDDENGYPVLEGIHITIREEVDLTEALTAILGERETRKVNDHLGPEHEYVDGKPRPCFYEEILPEEEWYWHSPGVLTDLVTADQLKLLLSPQWKSESDQKIMELYCSTFNWEVQIFVDKYYYTQAKQEDEHVTEIVCYAYGYAYERFIEHLEQEKADGA